MGGGGSQSQPRCQLEPIPPNHDMVWPCLRHTCLRSHGWMGLQRCARYCWAGTALMHSGPHEWDSGVQVPEAGGLGIELGCGRRWWVGDHVHHISGIYTQCCLTVGAPHSPHEITLWARVCEHDDESGAAATSCVWRLVRLAATGILKKTMRLNRIAEHTTSWGQGFQTESKLCLASK